MKMFSLIIIPFNLDREGNTMKKVSSKMKILLVLVICGAMMVPAMASAAENDLLPGGQEYGIGDDTLNLTLTGEATDRGDQCPRWCECQR